MVLTIVSFQPKLDGNKSIFGKILPSLIKTRQDKSQRTLPIQDGRYPVSRPNTIVTLDTRTYRVNKTHLELVVSTALDDGEVTRLHQIFRHVELDLGRVFDDVLHLLRQLFMCCRLCVAVVDVVVMCGFAANGVGVGVPQNA